MHVTLVLPGLIWPNQATRLTDDLALPALERLLGCATLRHSGRSSLHEALSALFGLSEPLPVAALRRLGEAEASLTTTHCAAWLCADPVHLHFAREHLLLTDASDLHIQSDEANQLLESLNTFLTEEDPESGQIEATVPDRWYLPLKTTTQTRFFPLTDVMGRPVSHFAPEGPDARNWARLANEIQVLLHNHPVNQAREQAGQPTINSVWFWGGGALPETRQRPAPVMHATDPVACGLARHSGMHIEAPDAPPAQDAIIVMDALQSPALRLDLETWRARLQQMELKQLAPLVKLLRAGRIKKLRCIAPGDHFSLALEISPFDLFKFWRRPRRLEDIQASS